MSFFNTVTCAQCKEQFGLRPETEAFLRKSHTGFKCPFGHPLVFNEGESEEIKLRRERDRLKQQLAEKDDRIAQERRWRHDEEERRQAAERRASAARGQVTRLKNRAAAGVCPCCNRSFENLRRHMASKHKGFVLEEVQAEVGTTIQ